MAVVSTAFRDAMLRADKRAKGDSSSKRLLEIVSIIKKHDVLEGLTPQKTTAILQDLGPTFVKLGQIASSHPDILPVEYCDALGQLRAHVTPMDPEVVRAQIEAELGKPVDELFSRFDDVALGSASIGQVHRAVIAETGRTVAVKVQRPGVTETVANDLALLKRLVELQGLISHKEGQISLKELVDELIRTSRDELDYTVEAANLARFHQNNEGRDGIRSPRCYTDYTTRAVLTMDYAEGVRVGDIDTVRGLDERAREELGYRVAQNYVEQILQDGFFHADPHAGNILLVGGFSGPEDPGVVGATGAAGALGALGAAGTAGALGTAGAAGTPDIEWIDFGMMGTISAADREVLKSCLAAVVKQDAYSLKRCALRLATPTGPIDHGRLLAQCEDIVARYVNTDLGGFDTGELFDDMAGVLRGQGFEINPSIVMLGRGLVTLEGTIRMISDRVNIMEVISRYLQSNFDPIQLQRRVRKAVGGSIEAAEALAELPPKASETLDMLQKGHLKLHMDLGAETAAAKGGRQALNNGLLAIMSSALFLGSCILCLTQMRPVVLGIPLFALVGMAVAMVLMAIVVVGIVRRR